MKYIVKKLSELTKKKINSEVTLEFFLCEDNKEIEYKGRPAMLVIPGGGYSFCSRREAEPIALRFMSEGFNCFVLNYTCKKPYPIPHEEVAMAIDYINKHAAELNIIKGCVSLIGFSAGGHLAASYSYLYKDIANSLKIDESNIKPFSVILGYPVISMKIPTESNSAKIITNNYDEKLVEKLSCEDHINNCYPPTFIWTTKTDQCVPFQHSKIMSLALKRNNIKSKLVIFSKGVHGGALCNRGVYDFRYKIDEIEKNKSWVDMSTKFIFELIHN